MNEFITSYIRDEMLANKDMDAELIWPICKAGESDEVLFRLLNRWARETDPINRSFIWADIQMYYAQAEEGQNVQRA